MRIEAYLDDEDQPRASFEPPETFELDTTTLPDGPHVLRVYAGTGGGARSVEQIPFTVRNGPGIAVVGLAENETVAGRVSLLVNAYQSRAGDDFEPCRVETPAPIPTWTWVLFLLVAAWSLWYVGVEFRSHAAMLAARAPAASADVADAAATDEQRALGEQVYGNHCGTCHKPDGEGLAGVFPPLRGDPVVTAADPTEHIRIVLEGLAGRPIDGVAYASPMPAFAERLSDAELAAVINHERTSWGNDAPAVDAADVRAMRAAAGAPAGDP